MRTPQNKLEIDMSKPINMEFDVECFGKEYDPTTSECSMCGMSDLCCIMFRKTTLTKKVKKLEREKFLDVTHFDINEQGLLRIIKEQPTEYAEVFKLIQLKTECRDANMIHSWIEVFMNNHGLTNKDGMVC